MVVLKMPEKRKILIVEDDGLLSHEIRVLLEGNNLDVVGEVVSYDEAIRLISVRRPDLVLIDVYIKGEKNGIELAHHINSHYNIPFIFFTVDDDSKTIERMAQTNPICFFKKEYPFKNSKEVLEKIKKSLLGTIQISTHRHESPAIAVAEFIDAAKNRNADYIQTPFNYDAIIAIQTANKDLRNGIEIMTEDGNKYYARTTLTAIFHQIKLPPHFVRISRSCILNFSKVTRKQGRRLFIKELEFKFPLTIFRNDIEKKLKIFSKAFAKDGSKK